MLKDVGLYLTSATSTLLATAFSKNVFMTLSRRKQEQLKLNSKCPCVPPIATKTHVAIIG